MFQHRSKCVLYQLGLMMLLVLLLIVGRISALEETKASSTEIADSEYSDDDGDSGPGEQQKPAGPKPYFDEVQRTIYVKPQNKTKIDCPVKKFNDLKHQIIWNKDNKLIANGNHSMSDEFQVDSKMNLIIVNFNKDTPGTYICQIEPGNITQRTVLKLAENLEDKNTASEQKAAWIVMILALILAYSLNQ